MAVSILSYYVSQNRISILTFIIQYTSHLSSKTGLHFGRLSLRSLTAYAPNLMLWGGASMLGLFVFTEGWPKFQDTLYKRFRCQDLHWKIILHQKINLIEAKTFNRLSDFIYLFYVLFYHFGRGINAKHICIFLFLHILDYLYIFLNWIIKGIKSN